MKKNWCDMFVDGARDGWRISINALLPNVIMAFTIIKVLEDTGIMKILGKICAPVMGLFGVPGEAIMVLVASLLSMGGGTAVAVNLYTSGTLSAADVTIVLPAIYLMGGQIQNVGRILGVIGIAPRFYPMLWGVTLFNGVAAMWIMRLIVK